MPPKRIEKFFKGRKVLITGATGHFGSVLTRFLCRAGAQVTALVRPKADLRRIQDITAQVEFYRADIRDKNMIRLAERIGSADIFYHLAAYGVAAVDNDPQIILETNVQGTLNALELARKLNVRRFVYCGSCFEYGSGRNLSEKSRLNPLSEYGVSKAAGGILAQAFGRKYGVPVVSLRPFTLYGPAEGPQRLMSHVITSVLAGQDVTLTSALHKRDFVFVEDAAQAFLCAAMARGIDGQTLNVASGRAVAVKDVVATIMRLMKARAKVQFEAIALRPTDVPVLSGSTRKAKEFLRWEAATSLEKGIGQTLASIRP